MKLKVMILVAMLLLVLAVAAPAFALPYAAGHGEKGLTKACSTPSASHTDYCLE